MTPPAGRVCRVTALAGHQPRWRPASRRCLRAKALARAVQPEGRGACADAPRARQVLAARLRPIRQRCWCCWFGDNRQSGQSLGFRSNAARAGRRSPRHGESRSGHRRLLTLGAIQARPSRPIALAEPEGQPHGRQLLAESRLLCESVYAPGVVGVVAGSTAFALPALVLGGGSRGRP